MSSHHDNSNIDTRINGILNNSNTTDATHALMLQCMSSHQDNYNIDTRINGILNNSNTTDATHAHIGESCPISMEPFQIGDPIIILTCGHTFSRGPFVEWLYESTTCPLCRCNLVPRTLRIGTNGRYVYSYETEGLIFFNWYIHNTNVSNENMILNQT